jgi:glycosyltransferase involved in cell wall biosynthesis
MNILLVAEDFMLNGVTRHIVDLANGLSDNGHTVFVAATPGTQKDKLRAAVPFIPLSLCYPESYKKRYSGIIKSFKILVRTIRENNIDIIHTHKRYADVLGGLAARYTGIKHVSTCHNKFTTYRRLSPFGHITIAPSPEIEQMLLQVFRMKRERIKFVSHGIKPLHRATADVLAQQRQALGIESDMSVILSVGHLNRQKDRATLIEAIHILQRNDQFKKAICLIVGEGEEYSHVRAMIHQYHLESLIKILPAESDIEVLNTMADFCVITSLYEAGPYVLLEAASLGKPTIGTTVGFIPSFVGNNEAGICVIPGQPHQMADAIYSLLSDPKKTSALGEKAYRQFMNNYTYDRFIKNTIAVYEEVLRAH